MSPSKKPIGSGLGGGGGERAALGPSGTAKADINLQNADGARAGGNAANNENTLFNKHYNKELKLCEGK